MSFVVWGRSPFASGSPVLSCRARRPCLRPVVMPGWFAVSGAVVDVAVPWLSVRVWVFLLDSV